jgi:hypothetical protein
MSLSDSLDEARELYALLQQSDKIVDAMMMRRERIEAARISALEFLRIWSRVMGILHRLNLGEDVNKLLEYISKVEMTVWSLYVALNALERGTLGGNILGFLSTLTVVGSAYTMAGVGVPASNMTIPYTGLPISGPMINQSERKMRR